MIIELDPDLESVLFEEFDAQYCRRRGDARFNADSDEAEVRSYLGTYFPRSWAEHTLIWKRLLVHKAIQNSLQSQDCIRLLDVGSGTGCRSFCNLAGRPVGVGGVVLGDTADQKTRDETGSEASKNSQACEGRGCSEQIHREGFGQHRVGHEVATNSHQDSCQNEHLLHPST